MREKLTDVKYESALRCTSSLKINFASRSYAT